MHYEGILKKMPTELSEPIQYFLDLRDDFIVLNQLVGRTLKISFKAYECLSCGSHEPLFAQGLCKKCFFESPQVGEWVMKPELSKAHLGIEDRDLAYEEKVQLKPHIVYLAKTSDIKVGVTRKTQIPYRWIDQGADAAIPILETPNRYLAGKAEVFFKQFVTDKTGWQKMLKGIQTDKRLLDVKDQLKAHLPDDLTAYWLDESEIVNLKYPVEKYPEKIKSINLEKTPKITGKLVGIKGQYLIFDDDRVLNIRNHSGYIVGLSL